MRSQFLTPSIWCTIKSMNERLWEYQKISKTKTKDRNTMFKTILTHMLSSFVHTFLITPDFVTHLGSWDCATLHPQHDFQHQKTCENALHGRPTWLKGQVKRWNALLYGTWGWLDSVGILLGTFCGRFVLEICWGSFLGPILWNSALQNSRAHRFKMVDATPLDRSCPKINCGMATDPMEYPLLICYIAVENDHSNTGFSHS